MVEFMIKNNRNLPLIFSIIFLIVSITPVSAALIHETGENSTSTDVVQDNISDLNNTISDLKKDMDELQKPMDLLNQGINYIKKRADDFSWKFWKWPGILSDIMETETKMMPTIYETTRHVNNLQKDAKKLEQTTRSANDQLNYNDDAGYMAEKLGNDYTVKKVVSSDVKEGDVVQYMSQGKYPRYLKVEKIIDKTEDKKTRNEPKIRHDIILAAIGGKMVLSNLDEYVILYNSKGKSGTDTIQNAAQIQENDINNGKSEAEAHQIETKNLGNLKDAALYLFIGCGVTAAVSFGVTIALALLSVPYPPLLQIIPFTVCEFVIASSFTVVLGIVFGIVAICYKNLKNMAADEISKVNAAQNDLNTYIKEEPSETMEVETFEGIPIVKQPSGWKNYRTDFTPRAEHGDVLMGPDIQFLYGPPEDYIGDDHFTIYAFPKQAFEIRKINVTVHVQPIPVLEIPKEA